MYYVILVRDEISSVNIGCILQSFILYNFYDIVSDDGLIYTTGMNLLKIM
jgi:hypothetical protein